MSIIRNWKEYFSTEEMLERWEKLIRKNADELVLELRKRRTKKFKSWTEVIFSKEWKLCMN